MAKIVDVQNSSLLFTEGSAPSTPASGFGRIYVKTTGLFFIGDNGVEVGPLAAAGGASSLQAGRVVRTSGDVSLTGVTTFQDVTGASITITTGAHRVLLGFTAGCYVNNGAGTGALDFTVDGTRVGGTNFGLTSINQHATASESYPVGMVYLTDVLSAASHTFKVQGKVANAAHTFVIQGADPAYVFSAVELYA